MDLDSLTTHGVVDAHVARVAADGVPHTITDHLIMDGVSDLPLLQSLYRKIYAGLKKGGPYHEHLGTVYLLRHHKGGRRPEGFGELGIPPNSPWGYDKLKLDPSVALAVAPIREIAEGNFAFTSTAPQILSAGKVTASLPSARKQATLTAGFQASDQERRFLEQQVHFLQREVELLRTRGPVAVVEGPGSRRARAADQPTSGNGQH